MGGRWGGSGAIASRSAFGVNAIGGSAAIASLAGVVAGLAVVRSVLSVHIASASLSPKRDSTCSHRLGAAEAGAWLMVSTARAAVRVHQSGHKYCMSFPSAQNLTTKVHKAQSSSLIEDRGMLLQKAFVPHSSRNTAKPHLGSDATFRNALLSDPTANAHFLDVKTNRPRSPFYAKGTD